MCRSNNVRIKALYISSPFQICFLFRSSLLLSLVVLLFLAVKRSVALVILLGEFSISDGSANSRHLPPLKTFRDYCIMSKLVCRLSWDFNNHSYQEIGVFHFEDNTKCVGLNIFVDVIVTTGNGFLFGFKQPKIDFPELVCFQREKSPKTT